MFRCNFQYFWSYRFWKSRKIESRTKCQNCHWFYAKCKSPTGSCLPVPHFKIIWENCGHCWIFSCTIFSAVRKSDDFPCSTKVQKVWYKKPLTKDIDLLNSAGKEMVLLFRISKFITSSINGLTNLFKKSFSFFFQLLNKSPRNLSNKLNKTW